MMDHDIERHARYPLTEIVIDTLPVATVKNEALYSPEGLQLHYARFNAPSSSFCRNVFVEVDPAGVSVSAIMVTSDGNAAVVLVIQAVIY